MEGASRQAMVDAALKRFAQAGRDAVGPRDLVKRLKLPASAVFKYFKSRDELFAAVLARVQSELFTYIEMVCPVMAGESGLSMALRLAEAYSRFLEERPAPYLEVLRSAAVSENSETGRERDRIEARIIKQFEVLLLLGRLDGSVVQEATADTARRMVNVIFGTVRLGLTRPRARSRNLRVMLTALAEGRRTAIRAA